MQTMAGDKRKGEYWDYLQGQIAEGAVPFFRFVKDGSDPDLQAKAATANANVKGAVGFDERWRNPDLSVRTGFLDKEPMAVQRRGIAIIKVGSGGIQAGNYVART
jgi:hypothetical protein